MGRSGVGEFWDPVISSRDLLRLIDDGVQNRAEEILVLHIVLAELSS